MKCKYCNKELPEIIDSSQDICGCEKSRIEWSLNIEIQQHKKILSDLSRKLKNLHQDVSVAKEKI